MVFQRLRTIGSLLQRMFVKKSAANKASKKKSIRFQLRHMLTEDAITRQPEEKGTHGFGDTVNPMPFKMNIGIYFCFLVIWIGIWSGGKLAHYGVSLLGDIAIDEDEDDDDDDENVRRAVKMSDESLKFTTYSDRKNYTKNILDDDDVNDNDNANDDTNDKSKDYTDSNVDEDNSADEQKKPDDGQRNTDGVDDQNLDNIEDVTFEKELKENEKDIEDEFDHVLENILKAGLELNQ